MITRFAPPPRSYSHYAANRRLFVSTRRCLLTLAIETSCDDTCVAILEKHGPSNDGTYQLGSKPTLQIHYQARFTSNNIAFRGIHPVVALESHQQNLGRLIQEALPHLPPFKDDGKTATPHPSNALPVRSSTGETKLVQKPTFITATRGPGMRSNLHTGLDTAKGLAIAWDVPLIAVNHMQAHTLTPRLVSALSHSPDMPDSPEFPFLSLLVSGGHTLLLHSKGVTDHEISAETSDIAIGDCLDKIARAVLPPDLLQNATSTSYGALLESFAFPSITSDDDYDYSPPTMRRDELARYKSPNYRWSLNPPMATSFFKSGSRNRAMEFSFSGLASSCERIVGVEMQKVTDRQSGTFHDQIQDKRRSGIVMDEAERRELARAAMKLAFEHLAIRVGFALKSTTEESGADEASQQINTLVISGGVAANKFLKHIMESYLSLRLTSTTYTRSTNSRARTTTETTRPMGIITPPLDLCTDNAVMIGWTGIEMFEAGWESELSCAGLRKWSLDEEAKDGGILGVGGWKRREGFGEIQYEDPGDVYGPRTAWEPL